MKHPWAVVLCAALFCAEAAQAGVSLEALKELPEVTASDLVARAQVKPGEPVVALAPQAPQPQAKPEKKPHGEGRVHRVKASEAKRGLTLTELYDAPLVSVGRLVEMTKKEKSAAPAQAASANKIATTLPKVTKAQAAGKVVRVEIPAASLEEDDVTATLVQDSARAKATAKPASDVKVSVTPAPVTPAPKALSTPATPLVLKQPQPASPNTPAKPVKPASDALELKIAGSGAKLKLYPPVMKFPHVGARADVKITADVPGLSLFVREAQILEWDSKTSELTARLKGSTELYVVAGGKMYIVPIVVEDAAPSFDIKVPSALVSLDGVLGNTLQSALYPSSTEQAVQVAQGNLSDSALAYAPSLNESVANTLRTAAEEQRAAARYANEKTDLAYRQVTLQLVDERSNASAGKLYPAAQVDVELVGTELKARTDGTGHLTIRDVPAHSRFLVRITDKTGAIAPAMAELVTDDAKGGAVVRIPVMRSFTLDTNAQIVQTAQHALLGTFCGTVHSGGEQDQPSEGVTAELDVQAEGPYYFNAMGYLDRSLEATGPNGRFCYFNVATGLAAVSLGSESGAFGMIPVAIYPGRHVEDAVTLGDERRLRTRLAAAPTAHIQLSADQRQAGLYTPVDMIDLLPLGTDEPMMQLASGLVATQDPVLADRGRVYAVSQGADFESVLYRYDRGTKGDTVTPLLPRGFIDDMSIYAQVAHDPALGAVLVEYAHGNGAGDGAVGMRLIDQDGNDVSTAWYFADQPQSKALFFNVPSGIYTLQVETADQYWLGADTVIVYNETVSYVRLGGSLKYRP